MQGRFTSPDEFKGGPDELFDFEEDASSNPTFYADLDNPQSLNKYQYTYNNPYKYNDPSGHCPPIIVAGVLIVIACITNPDYAVAPTGRETPEENRSYRNTYGGNALIDLIPLPRVPFLGKFGKYGVRKSQTAANKTATTTAKSTAKQTDTKPKLTAKQRKTRDRKVTKEKKNTSSNNTSQKYNKRGRSKIRNSQDASDQAKDIREAQKNVRKGKLKKRIDSTKKSDDREVNKAIEEFRSN